MTPRNIHFSPPEEETENSESALGSRDLALGSTPPRLRDVTNDPLREYASRPGEVRPLPDAVAALILSRKGVRCVERHCIMANVDGQGEREYSSPDSLVIAEMNGRGIKVFWVANRRNPDCIHLMSRNGEYLETLPLKKVATWFSADAVSQAAMAEAVSHRKREARRLAELHAPDIAAAAAREAHNAGELAAKAREDERIVRTFGAPRAGSHELSGAGARDEAPAFGKAERFCAVEEAVHEARTRRAQTPAVDLVKETLRAERVVKADPTEAWA